MVVRPRRGTELIATGPASRFDRLVAGELERMDASMEHDARRQQYRLVRDGETLSIADYRLIDDDRTVLFHHTFTLPQHRDHGYAAELVGRALDDVRATGRIVLASCWYVAQFIDEHPEYADLRAAG
jgi:predicted GNAT family acetyltransferase